MEPAEIDKRILRRVQRQERNVLRSLSWISIGIAILYVCGYVWRVSYYRRLGIPVSMIGFPFPEILIPKMHLVIFMVNVLFVIAYEKYYRFYTHWKRLNRAKKIGIDVPLELVHNYAFKTNSNSQSKTNYQVLTELLVEYININSKDNPQWKFRRVDFDKKALDLFKDIPPELKSSFISYSIELFKMDKSEIDQTIKDAIGWPPEGSKIYERIQTCALWGFVLFFGLGIIFVVGEVISTVICVALGVLVGYVLVKVSEVEARWQLWHMIWLSVFTLLILNNIDGRITAKYDLTHDRLPIATITQIDGTEHEGLLLGSFSDGYVIVPYDVNDIYKRRKIHKHEVAFINLINISSLRESIRKDKEKIGKLKEEIQKKSKTGEKTGS